MEQAVVKCKLPGDVTLELCRAVNGPANGEQQMLMFAEIKHCPDVKGGPYIGEVGLIHALMIDFHPDEQIG